VAAFPPQAGPRKRSSGRGRTALHCWHYDPTVKPLGKLLVAVAYNSRKNHTKGTKTEVVSTCPVHSTLAAMLTEWKFGGWTAMIGATPSRTI
jgi:hypothetical protein